MKRWTFLARICAFLLAANLTAVDTLPVFAAPLSEELTADRTQAIEENTDGAEYTSAEDLESENITGTEEHAKDPEADRADVTEPETAAPEDGKEPETLFSRQENSDGLIYVDGELYTGYYMDTAGILYMVSKGAAEVKTGTVSEGTPYYSSAAKEYMKLSKQTVYVEGKTYTGYYLDADGIFYSVSDGTEKPAVGIVGEGTPYYSSVAKEYMKLSKQTVYVEGKTYTGYYLDADGIFYSVSDGTEKPAAGIVGEGTSYYNSAAKEYMKLSKQTVYVEGKTYTGYYLDTNGIFYNVSDGTAKASTGTIRKGTQYYNNASHILMTLPRQTIYVEGKIYTGYYMDTSGKMYTVSNGAAKAKTGTVGKGKRYYSCSGREMLKLPKQILYVNGKVYTGYYLDSKNKMYQVKKGTRTLKNGMLKGGTKYYSVKVQKTRTLSKKTLYVDGKVYSGYYLDSKNKMYRVKKGTSIQQTGIVKAGTKYYSGKAKKTRKLSKKTLYVKAKVYTGYYLDSKKKMFQVKKGMPVQKTGTIIAGTKYYSYKAKKTLKLSKDTLYVKGNVYTGYYLDNGNIMYSVQSGTCTPVNTTLNAGIKYYNCHAGKMQTLSEQKVYVNGKVMEGMSAGSLATLQRAQAVVARITNSSMTKEEKLRVCFNFVKTYHEIKPRIPHYLGMDWPVIYANDMFVNGSGNCCSYAAAFAYMAKAIGYEEVYCCNSGGHGWAEIDGLVYDPEWSKWHHVYNYFALSYDTKTDQDYKGAIGARKPWMRIKI